MTSGRQEIEGAAIGPAVSLLFAPGERPRASEIRSQAQAGAGFSVSLDPATDDGGDPSAGSSAHWLELLASGLTFDLTGLSPGTAGEAPPRGHSYGLPAGIEGQRLEAIMLVPGPHLAGGGRMLPVVRTLAAVAAQLAALPGSRAVAWHPSRSWCAPDTFRESVLRWLEGGVFPAFGLAALVPTPDGGMQSEGMALFAGQELRLEPELTENRVSGAKIAVRLLHWLSEHGRVTGPEQLTGPDGTELLLEPSANERFVRVWKR